MKYHLLVLLSAALWGTGGITAGFLYGMSELSPLAVAFYRLGIASLGLLLALYLVRKRLRVQLDTRAKCLIITMGVAQALYQLLYFAAVASIGVSVATLLALCTAPVIVALIALALGQEALSVQLIATLFLAILGTYLLTGTDASVQMSVLGVTLALGAAASFASFIVLGRGLSIFHPLQVNALAFALGALVLAPFVAGELFIPALPTSGLLLYLGLIPTALSYTLFVWGLRGVSSSSASILALAEPLVATSLAWVLFGESLGAGGVLGASLLMIALFLSTRKGS